MSNETIILVNNHQRPSAIQTTVKEEEEVINHVNRYLYFIPICDHRDNVLFNIPILKNFKPANGIKCHKDAIYKSYAPIDREDFEQMEYLRNYIKDNLKESLKRIEGKKITIAGLKYLTFPELYFLNLFLSYIDFPAFETDAVTFTKTG